jgi:hypothetical protein
MTPGARRATLWPGRALCLAAGGLILFEHLSTPLPLTEAVAPPVYGAIAAEPGDFAILVLPLGWRNSYGIQGQEKTILQSFQAVHGKRLLGGNTSRNPAFTFTYYRRLPLIGSLIALEEGKALPAEAETLDRAAAPALLAFFDIRYVLVHRAYVAPAAEEYLARLLPLEKVSDQDGVAAYRLPPSAAGGPPLQTLDIGTPAATPALGEGWGENESGAGVASLSWALARHAELFLPAASPPPRALSLRMLAFAYPGAPPQTLRLSLAGQPLAELTLAGAWQDYRVPLPALAPGLHRLAFDFAYAASPSEVLGTPDKRTLAAALDLVTIEP